MSIVYYAKMAYNRLMNKCIIANCKNKAKYKNGLCGTHYERMRLHGTTDKQPPYQLKHGDRNSKEYLTWCNMRRRCYDKTVDQYKNYGARGVTVCDRWLGEHGYENFLADMGRRPSPKHSIDRIDVNKGYCPENCRWATPSEQAGNQRKTVWCLVDDEKKMCLSQAAGVIGMCRSTAYRRYWAGRSISPRIKLLGENYG